MIARCSKRLDFSPAHPESAKTASSPKAAASEEARPALRYVELLSAAKTLDIDYNTLLTKLRKYGLAT